MEYQELGKIWCSVEKGNDSSVLIVAAPQEVSEERTPENKNQIYTNWAEKEGQQFETFHQAVKEVEFLEGTIASVDDLRDSITHVVANFRCRVAKLHGIVPRLYSEIKDIQESFSECYDRFTDLLDKKLLEQRHRVANCSLVAIDFKARVEKLQGLLPSLYSEVKDIQLSLTMCDEKLLLNNKLLEERFKVANKHFLEKAVNCQSESVSSYQMSPSPSSESETITRVTTLDEDERGKTAPDTFGEALSKNNYKIVSAVEHCDEKVTENVVEGAAVDGTYQSTLAVESHSKQSLSTGDLEAAATLCDFKGAVNTVRKSKYEKKRAQKAREQARDAKLLRIAHEAMARKKKHAAAANADLELLEAIALWRNLDTSTPKYNQFIYGGYSFLVPEHSDTVSQSVKCSYAVKKIAGKGEGVIAMEDTSRCRPIIQERFIFLVERRMYSEPDELPSDDAIKAFLQERFTREETEPFLRLGNSYTKRQGYLGRLRTNMELVRMEQTGGTDANEGIPMFPTICKINHSCCPNSFFSWNSTLGCGMVYALHDIKQGEEITIAYKDMALQDFATRKTQLDLRWHIKCNCKRCSMSVAYRKDDDKHMHELVRELNNFEFNLHDVENEGTPFLSATILSKGRKIQTYLSLLAIHQNLDCLVAEWGPRVFYYLACATMSHGDIVRSRIFAQHAAEFYYQYRGSCLAANIMRALHENPKMHHRWGMYSSNWYQELEREPGAQPVALTIREDGEEVYVNFCEGLKDEDVFVEWLYRSNYEMAGLIK